MAYLEAIHVVIVSSHGLQSGRAYNKETEMKSKDDDGVIKFDLTKKKKFVRIVYGDFDVVGEVISAHNYGTEQEPEWYIELMDVKEGYIYFKQAVDHMQSARVHFVELPEVRRG